MDSRSSTLVHLHYGVPDVAIAAAALAECGLPLHRRYGRVDGDSVALDPGESPPDGFRLRLQDAQRGMANVTIAPGPALTFDHVGFVTAAFDDVVVRARDAGWHVNEGDRRTFLHTPWGFRVELHPPDGPVPETLGSPDEGRFERVELRVQKPDTVRSGLEEVLGPFPALAIEPPTDGLQADPMVSRVELGGSAIPDGSTLRARDLASATSTDT